MSDRLISKRNAMAFLAAAPWLIATSGSPSSASAPLNLSPVKLKAFSLPPLTGLDGIPGVDLKTLLGHVSVINFWASWCGACRTEHLHLNTLRQQGLRMVGINAFDADNAEAALNFLKRDGNPYQFVGVDPKKGGLGELLGVNSIPQTFVIGRHAEILWQTTGRLNEYEIPDVVAAVAEASRTG